jgi:uncharacterized protein (TIGR02246 family)
MNKLQARLVILFLVVALSLTVAAIIVAASVGRGADSRSARREIEATLARMTDACRRGDLHSFSRLIGDDPNLVAFGSSECWIGRQAILKAQNRLFSARSTVRLDVRRQVVRVLRGGETACFSLLMDRQTTAAGQTSRISGLRLSGVLEKQSGTWLIVQWHESLPASGPKDAVGP